MVQILQVDRAGAPVAWLSPQDAANYEASGKVLWSLGDPCIVLRGGTNRVSGELSLLPLHPIISVRERKYVAQKHSSPAVSRVLVLRRDRHMCAYCGQTFKEEDLTLDHVYPKSRGGGNVFTNLISACRRCNCLKAARSPEEAKMPLLFVPYVPNMYEAFILRNRTILFDQHEFLKKSVPRHSRLHS